MAQVKVLLPQWGMGMSEGTITSWIKSVGDTVEEGDAIATVEAEKVEDEVPAPRTGTWSKYWLRPTVRFLCGPQLPLLKHEADGGNS